MFKWAIFSNEQDAIDIKNACNVINLGAVEYRGAPPYDPPVTMDYTLVIKHYNQNQWAVLLDDLAQELLSGTVTMSDPDPSWFETLQV